jgi:HSP20 family protein
MFGLTTRRKRHAETAGNGGALTPFGDFPFLLSRMRDEFDRMFERMTQEWGTPAEGGPGWRWGLDVKDEADAVVVQAEAPGFEPKDFDLSVRDDALVLRASRKEDVKDKDGKVIETRQRECYDSVSLPPGIDKDKVNAKYVNGMLTVTLPKTADGQGKRIPVKNA